MKSPAWRRHSCLPGPDSSGRFRAESLAESLRHHARLLALMAATAVMAFAQQSHSCPETSDGPTYPNPPFIYPMTSNRYAVQYQLGGAGTWSNAQVYISYYGGTNSSPYLKASSYPADESMSFVSIPAAASTAVAVRVTKIWGSPLPAIGQMSVRPKAKGVQISSVNATTVQLSTSTAAGFAGDQFVLWWNGDSQQSSSIQGLAIFLDPPYVRPTGSSVKVVASPADLTADLSAFDTLDVEGTVAVGGTGDQAFLVPANIDNIFLSPGAWLQGKLRFTQSGAGNTRKLYGPGVLDASRFNYAYRHCQAPSAYADDGYQSLSWVPLAAGATGQPDSFVVDGLVISDSDFYATDQFANSTVNNLKIIAWNSNNDGFQLGLNVRVSNVFVRTGDDSLKMWGSSITVTNATVWQNWNGGVVNLGWDDNSHGDDCLIDGLYVVKTDWNSTNTPSFTNTDLNSDNNAIMASMMTPSVNFGASIPSVYRNLYVEDPPRVLFSLKVSPVECASTCPGLGQPSVLNLNVESLSTPPSTLQNPIGFQTVNGAPLPGAMNIALTNVLLTLPDGTATPLTSANAATLGKITTNGPVNIIYPKTPTTIVLSASPSPAAAGQTVTLRADLSPSGATGTVSFFDGAGNLGKASLSAGVATLTTGILAVGNHVLAASYTGDANYGPSLSPVRDLTVNPAVLMTTTTLLAVPATPAAGQSVTLTATVTPATATGTVSFQDGATAIGAVNLTGGSASMSTSTLAAGSHTLTAAYGGDSHDASSVSAPLALTVSPVAPPSLTYVPGSSVKLYQVNGDCDWTVWDATISNASPTCKPTTSRTATKADVLGDDVPVVFEHNGELIVTFGDTIGAAGYGKWTKVQNSFQWQAHDPIARSTTTNAPDGLLLNFFQSGNHALEVQPVQPDGTLIDMGADNVPNTGVSLNGQIYLGIKSGAVNVGPGDNDLSGAYSILSTFDESAGTFAAGRTISSPPNGHFILPTFYLAPSGVLSPPPPGSPAPVMLIFGLGQYRASNIYLSVVPSAQFAGGVDERGNAATRYFAGMSYDQPRWSASEADAAPIVTDLDPANPTIGNLSVFYSQPLGLWLMMYDGGRGSTMTSGMYFTYAAQPWGPWSTPQLVFNNCRDKGLGNFVFYYYATKGANFCPSAMPAGVTSAPNSAGPSGPTIGDQTKNDPTTTTGGAYAPALVERFTIVSGNTLKLFYMFSTWNPYAVVMMESDFTIADGPVIQNRIWPAPGRDR